MNNHRRLACLIACAGLCMFAWRSPIAGDEDHWQRQAEEFLSDSRISQWSNVFKQGLPKMGRVVLIVNGKVRRESWFEDDYALMRQFRDDVVITTISNPDYSAVVESTGDSHRILHVGATDVDSDLVYLEAIPFAICSSFNHSRKSIPLELQKDTIALTGYRHEDGKHILEFKSSIGSDESEGATELIFNENSPSVFPDAAVHNKGTPDVRHLVNSDFTEVEGYVIPLKFQELDASGKTLATAEAAVFPDDQLNDEMCRLSYYNLPEPGELTVTDFGRKGFSGLQLAAIALVAIGALSMATLWYRTRTKR